MSNMIPEPKTAGNKNQSSIAVSINKRDKVENLVTTALLIPFNIGNTFSIHNGHLITSTKIRVLIKIMLFFSLLLSNNIIEWKSIH